jgi:hypothetical protein
VAIVLGLSDRHDRFRQVDSGASSFWSVAAVLLASTICAFTLPFDWHILSVATIGVFCATTAGIMFYCLNVCFPIDRPTMSACEIQ